MEAYFINAPIRKGLKAGSTKKKTQRRNKMAKKRRQPAALRKYWAAKKSGKTHHKKHKKAHRKASKARKSTHAKRRRHVVHAHKVHTYRRPKSGSSYLSNPVGSLGRAGSTVVDGLIAAAFMFGSLFAAGYINGMSKKVAFLGTTWGSLATKLAIGLGVGYAAHYASSKRWLSSENSKVVAAAGFAPLALDLLGRIAPQVAGQIQLAGDGDNMGAELAMTPGDRLSDATIDAQLAAELSGESDSESSAY